MLSKYLALSAGGFAGSVARYGLSKLGAAGAADFPWATLLINLSGSFVLGFFLTLVNERYPGLRLEWRLFLAPGLLGSYTTFSTFSVEAANLYRAGLVWTGLLYSFLSLVGGMLLVWGGFRLARFFTTLS